MLLLIEIVILLLLLAGLSLFTEANGQFVLLDRVVSPIVLSLVSIVVGMLLMMPILVRQNRRYRKNIRGFKKENKEVKKENKEMKKEGLDLLSEGKTGGDT